MGLHECKRCWGDDIWSGNVILADKMIPSLQKLGREEYYIYK